MDKKIILSVLIVALIGIVAATYQINTGDILNPLASVETEEESPVTEVFTAPETQEDAQAQAEADAQAQAQADAQAQAEAQAKADAQAEQQSQENTQSQSVAAGTTQKSSLVGSGDTIVVQGSSNGGQSSSSDSGSDSSSNSGSDTSSDNTVDNSGTENTQSTPISSDMISTIKSVLEPIIDSSILSLEMDKGVLEDNLYKIPATYKDTGNYAGTFYVDKSDLNNWYYIDSQNNYYTEETPFPGKIDNGALVTE